MRILHAITGLAEAAGTSVFATEIAARLVATGHECAVAVCSPNHGIYRPHPELRLIPFAKALEEPWDFVHVHALWAPALHRFVRRLQKRRIPYAVSPHGMLTPWALNHRKWKKLLALWLYQKRDLAKAAFLHATAQTEVDDIRRLGLSNPVAIAPLGIEVPESSDRPATRGKTILYLGRLQRKKGILNLVEAWAEVRRAHWRIVVAGPDQEGYLAEVKALAAKLGVLQDFDFPGPVFGEEKSRLYREAAFFVLPSFSENFGSVVIEALAEGTPVVTTKGTPWQELEESDSGLWIDTGTQALAAALTRMMDFPQERLAAMGERGRDLVREKYSWPAAAKTLLAAYKSALANA